ncbi:universal stress protein UspA-like protein [Rivularia sp. PCC 7116]|uniref:universal stress protein n=1 Tax=Rivularia sp. PCC 7116 TaxID=373994 RepID=UPI00029ECA5E|nr:universal stress protein [Rivularia sp. PCC 7116]AFY55526.1 universal stress protein UspA-like protein [Rivularia sp. PCC 7116]
MPNAQLPINMFNQILVSIDDSDMTQHVVDEAVSLAKATNGSLMFLHAISLYDNEPYFDPLFMESTILDSELHNEAQKKSLKVWEEFKQGKKNWLSSLCESAAYSGVKAEFTLNVGEASKMICDMARSWNADIIVIGRRGHRGLTELFLGSVSNYVIHHAPCSVLTVQRAILSDDVQR